MQIGRDSFVIKIAYYFTAPKERPVGNINGCNLFWRFVLFGCLYLLASFTLLPILSVVLVCTLVVRWVLGVLVGCKLQHYRKSFHEDFWMERFVVYTWPTDWRWVRIESWPTVFGRRILPAVITGGLFLILMIAFLVCSLVYLDWHLVWLANKGDTRALMLIVAQAIIVLAIALVFLIPYFQKTLFVRLAAANVKSFKDRTCPLVKIV